MNHSSNAPLITSNIRHTYQGRGGDVLALDGVSLQLQPQTFTCLIGPSGCGKSTLLRVLAGLVKPSAGTVRIQGDSLSNANQQLGVVFQNPTLMPWRTVLDNLALPLELEGVSKQIRYEQAARWLNKLGLEDFGEAYPAALSGGMAQRLAIGRGLIHQPHVLLLDEPFGALDALTREQVSGELLRIWAQDRKTVLMVTHSIREAVLLSDRVLVMSPRPGKIVQDVMIDLPRPRSLDMVTQPDFVAYEAELRGALRL